MTPVKAIMVGVGLNEIVATEINQELGYNVKKIFQLLSLLAV